MTKIYEAMEQASKERGEKLESGPASPLAATSCVLPDDALANTLLRLYYSIESLLPDATRRSVQFIASVDREGSSVLVREFAKVAAERLHLRVLLLDGDFEAPKHAAYFGLGVAERGTEMTIHQVGESGLHVAELPKISGTDASASQDALAEAADAFDLILIDSPPPSRCPEGLALSARADGVVLVIEAEQTRWQVVQQTRESIERQGGRILGALLNKRKHYIPDSVYRRL